MDSRQLRYFAAIFEEGALARAAVRERIAVSALSRHLANLEAELGKPLFERLPRGVRPTASGARLYEHTRTILRSMQAASADIRDTEKEVAGEISVGFSHSAVKAIGVPLMQRVLQSYPKLRLHLSEIFSGSTTLQLASSEVDLALTGSVAKFRITVASGYSLVQTTFERHSDIDVESEILFEETNRGCRIVAADRRPHTFSNNF